MVAKNNAIRSHIKAGIKHLLLRSDGQPRGFLQALFHTFQHVAPLRKCAKKIVLSKEGKPRPFFAPLYSRFKASKIEQVSCNAGDIAIKPIVPSAMDCVRPRLTVVAMARNESVRAHDMMRHFCALFDRIVLIDHMSEDDTARIALSYNGVEDTEVVVLRGEDSGYYQSEYMSACANALLREAKTDWIFFLDFDEILPFSDAFELRQALVDRSDSPIIQMHWHNIALKEFDPVSLQGAIGLIGQQPSSFVKVAINVSKLGSAPIIVEQGNHAVHFLNESTQIEAKRAFGMMHVPILGVQALKAKIAQGVKALKQTVGKDAILGFHWHEMSAEMDTLLANEELVRCISLYYSRPLKDILGIVQSGQAMEGVREIALKFAQCRLVQTSEGPLPSVQTFTLDTITDVLNACFPVTVCEKQPFNLPEPLYHPLPSRLASGETSTLTDALMAAISADVVCPKAECNGHIPVLAALLEVYRPQRYVEIGADSGASIFAVCQHINSNGKYGEAVAIGDWNDIKAGGRFGDDQFNAFKSLLGNKFPKIGKFIRGTDDAVSVFREKSIDFLYIKGVLSFKDAKKVFENWRPRLTNDAVILFQNTNGLSAGLGVWQYFENIRENAAASFQFSYGSGIGILAFGAQQNNPVISLIAHFRSQPEKMEFLFSQLGRKISD